MKLLIISAAFPPMTVAGEADHAYLLAQHLGKYGCEVHVLTNRGVQVNGLTSLKIYPVMNGWTWLDALQIIRVVNQCRPDTVLLFYSGGHLYQGHSMISFSPTFLKAIFPGIRIITQFENHFPSLAKSFVARVIRKIGKQWFDGFGTLLRRSDGIVLLSFRQGEALVKHYPAFYEKKIVVIPPPPLIPILDDAMGDVRKVGREKLGLQPNAVVLAFFGLIYPGKGLETLVEAFQRVLNLKSNIWLALIGGVGSGETGAHYEEQVRARIDQLGIGEKVIWTGGYQAGSEDPSIYLHAADLCVLPMDRGIALNNSSLAAAVAHGLAVIATRGEIVEEFLRHEHNIFLCAPQNPSDLARAIVKVLDNPKIYEQLQAGGRELAKECFAWEIAAKRTLEACFGTC